MTVAGPRNHRYLQFEVAGFRRPRCVFGPRPAFLQERPQGDLAIACDRTTLTSVFGCP